jgi:hypothetical protein
MLVGEIQCLTLEMWIQGSNPATQTPVGVEISTGYGPSHRGSEGSLAIWGILTSTKSPGQKSGREEEGA